MWHEKLHPMPCMTISEMHALLQALADYHISCSAGLCHELEEERQRTRRYLDALDALRKRMHNAFKAAIASEMEED